MELIAIYGLIIGLLVPSVKKDSKGLAIAILGMSFNYIFVNILKLGSWSLVLATIIAGAFGIISGIVAACIAYFGLNIAYVIGAAILVSIIMLNFIK